MAHLYWYPFTLSLSSPLSHCLFPHLSHTTTSCIACFFASLSASLGAFPQHLSHCLSFHTARPTLPAPHYLPTSIIVDQAAFLTALWYQVAAAGALLIAWQLDTSSSVESVKLPEESQVDATTLSSPSVSPLLSVWHPHLLSHSPTLVVAARGLRWATRGGGARAAGLPVPWAAQRP